MAEIQQNTQRNETKPKHYGGLAEKAVYHVCNVADRNNIL